MRIESMRPRWRLALRAGPMAVLVVAIVFVSGTPARGRPATVPGQPVTVLSGSYSCDVNDVIYVEPPGTEPETFRETVDRISFGSTGGVMTILPGGVTPIAIGPGFGGRGGRVQPAIPDIGGLFTGHSFDGGTIEDCLRFANSVASAAQSLGCVVSDVRHRHRVYSIESASVSFVCEGPATDQLHAIGELSRLVITLKPQP